MAAVLVQVETVDETPLGSGLSALGAARRIGSALGATVYAAVAGAATRTLVAALGVAGTDKVIVAGSAGAGSHDATMLLRAWNRLRPIVTIFTDDEDGRTRAAALATETGARLMTTVDLELGSPPDSPIIEGGRSGTASDDEAAIAMSRTRTITAPVGGGHRVIARGQNHGHRDTLLLDELDRPLIITVSPTGPRTSGSDEAEIVVLEAPPGPAVA